MLIQIDNNQVNPNRRILCNPAFLTREYLCAILVLIACRSKFEKAKKMEINTIVLQYSIMK